MLSAPMWPPAPGFVGIFNPVILTHSNSGGSRGSCCPLGTDHTLQNTYGDQGKRWKIHTSQLLRPQQSLNVTIHKSMVLQRTAQGKANINGKGYNPVCL